jgi:hypothetical protein
MPREKSSTRTTRNSVNAALDGLEAVNGRGQRPVSQHFADLIDRVP